MWGRYVSPDDAAIERHFRIDGRSPHPLNRRFNVAYRDKANAGE